MRTNHIILKWVELLLPIIRATLLVLHLARRSEMAKCFQIVNVAAAAFHPDTLSFASDSGPNR